MLFANEGALLIFKIRPRFNFCRELLGVVVSNSRGFLSKCPRLTRVCVCVSQSQTMCLNSPQCRVQSSDTNPLKWTVAHGCVAHDPHGNRCSVSVEFFKCNFFEADLCSPPL